MQAKDELRTQIRSGEPDVVMVDPTVAHLYVAVGDPSVIDVFDTDTLNHLETIATDPVRKRLASIRLSMGSAPSRL